MADAKAVNVPHTRRTVVLLAALAIVSLQFARTDHIHPAGVEGRTQSVVHSHPPAFAGSGGARAFAVHGDHRLAIFIASIYESVLRAPLGHPLHALMILNAAGRHEPHFHAVADVQQHGHCRPPGVLEGASPGRAPPLS